MTRGRNAQLVRTLMIARRLRGRRMLESLESLAVEFEVCTRTIYRDLQALEEAGWPLPQYRYFPKHVLEIRAPRWHRTC